jgi:lipoic acid synthetase
MMNGKRHETRTANSMTRSLRFPQGADPGRRPEWLKVRLNYNERAKALGDVIKKYNLNTVCSEAKCPNIGECWGVGTATIMILGDTCTRKCSFCAVATGKPNLIDPNEPANAAKAIKFMNLGHVVITSVDRDDLADGGAAHWAKTISAIHELCPETSVEVLTGDFKGKNEHLEWVLEAQPEVFSHNLETTRRLTWQVRSNSDFDRSLGVLQHAVKWGARRVKTGIMLGLGETMDEVKETMRSAADVGVQYFSVGQYLRPTRNHHQVQRFWTPMEFEEIKAYGNDDLGFINIESGALVRSSYHAEKAVQKDSAFNEV